MAEQLARVERVSLAESGTLKYFKNKNLFFFYVSVLPRILGLAAAQVSPQGSRQVRAGILEVFVLLPFVGHQTGETFDTFLLTLEVANLVSFKVHDQTNVDQAGTENIQNKYKI